MPTTSLDDDDSQAPLVADDARQSDARDATVSRRSWCRSPSRTSTTAAVASEDRQLLHRRTAQPSTQRIRVHLGLLNCHSTLAQPCLEAREALSERTATRISLLFKVEPITPADGIYVAWREARRPDNFVSPNPVV